MHGLIVYFCTSQCIANRLLVHSSRFHLCYAAMQHAGSRTTLCVTLRASGEYPSWLAGHGHPAVHSKCCSTLARGWGMALERARVLLCHALPNMVRKTHVVCLSVCLYVDAGLRATPVWCWSLTAWCCASSS